MFKLIMASALLAICIVCYGCFAVVGEAVNPYKSGFNCPPGDKGKCISVPDAYRETLMPKGSAVEVKNTRQEAETAYQTSLYKKLGGLLEEPHTPAIAPPKIMRALLLPYKGSDKELFMYRYVFFVVDDYTWVLGDNDPVGDH
jgi:conjugal transfer pilus assembly protein TraV